MSSDFLIAGGGIIGLTIARELLRRHPKARVVLLEKEASLGCHASGRNSGVLHSGIYYPAETMKAKACATGAKRLAEYCHQNDLPIRHIGKLVVASSQEESESLLTYKQRAETLGVPSEWIDPADIHEVEPAAAADYRALHLPNVAVINARAVLEKLATEVRDLGGEVLFDHQVMDIDVERSNLRTNHGDIPFGFLINAAGAHVDRLASPFGLDRRYMLMPFKGQYYSLSESSGLDIRGLIYPVPDARLPFLGIHFTCSVDNHVYIGPSAMPVLGREHYAALSGIEWGEMPERLGLLAGLYAKNRQGFRRLTHREMKCLGRSHFAAEAARLVPGIKPEHLQSCAKKGIRPQLFDRQKKEMVMDFLLEKKDNSLHVLNAISPALTCSFSIATHVVDGID